MSEGISDVEMLFSPPRNEQSDVEMIPEVASEEHSREPSAQTTTEELSRLTSLSLTDNDRLPSVYVEVPSLPPAAKAKYATDLKERSITSDEEFPEESMERIVGEYEVDGELHYFVRMSSGMAFKFPAKKFAKKHPGLVEEYDQNKEDDTFDHFDPSASYIHPDSRIKLTLKVGPSYKAPSSYVSESEDELAMSFGELSASESEDDVSTDDGSDAVPLRKSSRVVTVAKADKKRQTTLPFSPKKTRSRKIISLVEDDEEEDDAGSSRQPTPAPSRRSTRAAKRVRGNLDDDDFIDDDDDDDEGPSRGKSRTIKKKPAPKKVIRGYGIVHDHPNAFSEELGAMAHRRLCEKCRREPTHKLLQKVKKGRPKKRKTEDDFEDDGDDYDRTAALGGWVRCLKCPVVAHWGCLAKTQRDEIVKAIYQRDKAKWEVAKEKHENNAEASEGEVSDPPEPKKRAGLATNETTEFICGSCMKGGVCMACRETAIEPGGVLVPIGGKKSSPKSSSAPADGDVIMADRISEGEKPAQPPKSDDNESEELLFRCMTCKRLAHYAHLPLSRYANPDSEYTADERAEWYQSQNQWQCADCVSFTYSVEHILAWRPFPEKAVEPRLVPGTLPDYKAALPREYLVKWVDRSYKRLQWVPHMWLLATYPSKLKNFLVNGSRVPLLPEPIAEDAVDSISLDTGGPAFAGDDDEIFEEIDGSANKDDEDTSLLLMPLPDAERMIPLGWKTTDRVLDILLWNTKSVVNKKPVGKGKKSARHVVTSDGEDEVDEASGNFEDLLDDDTSWERKLAYEEGEQPGARATETIASFEKRKGRKLREGDISLVAWGFFKWIGLGYEDAAWDSPPPHEAPGWHAFEDAFKRFLAAQTVTVPLLSPTKYKQFDARPKNVFMKKYKFTSDAQPELGQDAQLKLMPFQVDGVNWLCNNWWNLQHCILADEMGLGKTVQIVTFLGRVIQGWDDLWTSAFPALVVVPNSTITNWVREFERWAPNLRVVPYYGDTKARNIIKEYELYHQSTALETTGARFHVLVTTYETVTTTKDVGTLFKAVPRWEVLVVDEGQRLKNDTSLLFKKLRELKTIHRIILTGTPLNNNIRELFNLMHFLDPLDWSNLEDLEKEYENLNEEKIKDLHKRLRPYFLRRIKSEVLQLPPKNEVIVPVSMSALQKEVYRSILSQNVDILQSIAVTAAGSKVNAAVKKSNMNNILMQLRKCLQHPYLVSRNIEPSDLTPKDTHEKLIGASAKLVMLHAMLPKLRARGHRVLLFSQFTIALDIIEDFLNGEGIKYLRLDGSTKQPDRQKGMDEFNKPDSDVFIYILSTRAGGVGINLTTADTVIIFDPDFNPHQDLQAIARAHRYGQKKTCLVFKFMVKDSAEERIMQTGKKKLVLDHLIVQNMDDKDAEKDVQSILMFGAQALFQQGDVQSAKDIHYSDHDIQHLIEKTEKEGDQQESTTREAFSFAKVWSAEQDDDDTLDGHAEEDAWAQTLARIAEERLKERAKEETGRGVRRKAAAVFPQQTFETFHTPTKGKSKKSKGKQKATNSSDDDAFNLSEIDESDRQSSASSAASDDLEISLADQLAKQQKRRKSRHIDHNGTGHGLSPGLASVDLTCGLCGVEHPNRPCYMTESSENLAEYRRILTTMDSEEPIEVRRAAVAVIDETLHKRGKMKLIINQPLHPVERNPAHRPLPQPTAVRSGLQTAAPIAAPRLPPVLPQARVAVNGTGTVLPSGHASANGVPSSRPSAAKLLPKPRPKVSIPADGPARTGPPRRLSSPNHASGPPKKKVKESAVIEYCVVCSPPLAHPLVHCPIVMEGPQRIEKEIRKLRKDPAKTEAVDKLQKILLKQRSHPM